MKTKLIIFTSGNLQEGNKILIERFVKNPEIELVGVIVDNFSQSPIKRAIFLGRKWGTKTLVLSLSLKFIEVFFNKLLIPIHYWHDLFIPRKPPLCYEQLKSIGVNVIEVDNIHQKESIENIKSLSPDIGLILGGRILKKEIIDIPKKGTLNIHKHDARKYRGGPQIGYVERKNNESKLYVTIHYAVSEVDSGDIVAMEEIPIEKYDNDLSLQIKANIVGANLYYKIIEDISSGIEKRIPQDLSEGKIYYTTPYWDRYFFWRRYKTSLKVALKDPLEMRFAPVFRFLRTFIFYLILPYLSYCRKRLESSCCAPIIIFYYHGIGNGADNWMSLPLEVFSAQINYMRKYFEIIDVKEAVKRLRSGKNTKTSIVLTFDDGYENCYNNVVPYLKFYNLPATFFICAKASVEGEKLPHDLEKGYNDARLLSASQIKEMADYGFEIGSHGNRHEDMGKIHGDELQKAIIDSKEILEKITSRKISFLSFPKGGKNNFSQEAICLASKHYDAVFSAFGGYNKPTSSDRFHFFRMANPNDLKSLMVILGGLHRLNPYYG